MKKKSSELHSLTGDGRLDLMDVLLEFTKVIKEKRNNSFRKEDSSESPENENFRTKIRKYTSDSGTNLLGRNSPMKSFGSTASYNSFGRPRFQVVK